VNPNGRIPAIDDNGFKLWESMAINLYLARKHGSGLLPKTMEDEAQAIQWSFWVMTEVEKPALAVLLHRFFLPEDQRDSKLADEGEQQLQKPLEVLDQRADHEITFLSQNKFFVIGANCGSRCSTTQKQCAVFSSPCAALNTHAAFRVVENDRKDVPKQRICRASASSLRGFVLSMPHHTPGA
jgi:hypothetical protein